MGRVFSGTRLRRVSPVETFRTECGATMYDATSDMILKAGSLVGQHQVAGFDLASGFDED